MRTIVLSSSLLLAILVVVCSIVGLTTQNFYNLETPNWKIQAIGQDAINLFVGIPFLLVSAFYIFIKKLKALSIWGGTMIYFLYTFSIYCFNIHFNTLFLVYCFALSVAFYSVLYYLYLITTQKINLVFKKNNINLILGIYLLLIGVLFLFLWLSSIIPAIIANTIPKDLFESGLFTNPVHVIDIAILIPALIFVGVLLIKKKAVAGILGNTLLSFSIIMNITVGYLAYFMFQNKLTSSFSVVFIMGGLTIVSSILIAFAIKNMSIKKSHLVCR